MFSLTRRRVHEFQNVEVEEEHVDERSVDDLLSFINGEDGGNLYECFHKILLLFWHQMPNFLMAIN